MKEIYTDSFGQTIPMAEHIRRLEARKSLRVKNLGNAADHMRKVLGALKEAGYMEADADYDTAQALYRALCTASHEAQLAAFGVKL